MKIMALLLLTCILLYNSCNELDKTSKNIETTNEVPIAIGDTVSQLSNNIMVIYQDNKNNYWFGSWEDGLYKYNGKSIIHFTAKDGLTDNRVEEIKEDKQGNIYINTRKGLFVYNGNSFLKLKDSLSSGKDWKLTPDDLWFKSLEYAGYVYRLDGINLFRLKFPKTELGEDYIQKHPNYPNPYAVYCIYKDRNQNVWFGTSTLGACRFNGKTFDWISEQDITEIHDGPANGVRSISEDKDGFFWFNTEYRYRVYKINSQTTRNTSNSSFYDRIKSIGSLDGKKDGDLNEFLSIIRDDKNNLWIAIYLNGVWQYDGEKIKHYPIQINGKNIPIFCLLNDNNGNIWLGTHENGVFKFNGKTFEKQF